MKSNSVFSWVYEVLDQIPVIKSLIKTFFLSEIRLVQILKKSEITKIPISPHPLVGNLILFDAMEECVQLVSWRQSISHSGVCVKSYNDYNIIMINPKRPTGIKILSYQNHKSNRDKNENASDGNYKDTTQYTMWIEVVPSFLYWHTSYGAKVTGYRLREMLVVTIF